MTVPEAILQLIKAINESQDLNNVQKTHFTKEIFKMKELLK